MPRKRLVAEQIVTKLRKIVSVVCKESGITEESYDRYQREYGCLNVDQAKRLKQLENDNNRLKKLVANLSLEKNFLKDAAQGEL